MPDAEAAPVHDVKRYVVDRGCLPPLVQLTATELTGGVSGFVVLVRSADDGVVVKRALGQLRVDRTWYAKPERALTEAAALAVLHDMTPQHTPRVLDVDVEQLTFTMTAAPDDWRTWKDVLLDGATGSDDLDRTAETLGSLLATWHRGTWKDSALAARFADYEALEQLRLLPFHETVAAKHPDLAEVVLSCADELRQRRDCLVHGDFSPKNVLVGDGLWVLDFEVAHFGAAVFDVAFMQSHLMIKAIHMPDSATALHRAAMAMIDAYRTNVLDATALERVAEHTACLMLARVDGLSPADYLTPEDASHIRVTTTSLLQETDPSLDCLWALVLATTRCQPTSEVGR